jgi:hypothetical protein
MFFPAWLTLPWLNSPRMKHSYKIGKFANAAFILKRGIRKYRGKGDYLK